MDPLRLSSNPINFRQRAWKTSICFNNIVLIEDREVATDCLLFLRRGSSFLLWRSLLLRRS